jgi:hypothetical protein
MASSIFDDDRVVATQACSLGHPVPILLGAARRHRTIACPTCGERIKLTANLGQLVKGADPTVTDSGRPQRNIRRQ